MNRDTLESFAIRMRKRLQKEISEKLSFLLKNSDSITVIENPTAYNSLLKNVEAKGEESIVEEVSYTWFNRLSALRYMDVKGYLDPMVITPNSNSTYPELLSYYFRHILDDDFLSPLDKAKLEALADGKKASLDPNGDIYRILFVLKCNELNNSFPFLFEKISDYTELLLPDNLLIQGGIIEDFCSSLTPDNLESVEVIGWLYQYYISERKKEVYDSFNKGVKAGKDEIPPATQLFTPEWIVRYLVDNSLGRLILLNNPDSKIRQSLSYYIEPKDKEIDFIHYESLEDIKICDPCSGSGHMLVYAFDILFAAYMEAGYTEKDAVISILTNNLYGIEIDKRASQLSYFALMIKAREKYRRFFSLGVEPNICVLEPVHIEDRERDTLFSVFHDANLDSLLTRYESANILGSLITSPSLDYDALKAKVLDIKGQSIFNDIIVGKIEKVIKYSEYLSGRYDIVVTNPPYLGSSKFSPLLLKYAQDNYPNSKSDFCTMFIERGLRLLVKDGYSAMVTMQSWMFLSSFEVLRKNILKQTNICCLAQMANMVMRIAFGTSATVFKLGENNSKKGIYSYVELNDMDDKDEAPLLFPPHNIRNKASTNGNYYFECDSSQFSQIPGSPIAYWLSDKMIDSFNNPKLGEIAAPRQGLATGDNNRFLREWWEVNTERINFSATSLDDAQNSHAKWFLYNKGGEFRKWYGNNDYVVNWENDGYEIRNFYDANGKLRSRPQNTQCYFKEAITWSKISSGTIAFRYKPCGHIFDVAGTSIFVDRDKLLYLIGFVNSSVSLNILKALSPTLNFEVGQVASLPLIYNESKKEVINTLCKENISLSKVDWDSFEISWDFRVNPLVDVYRKEVKDNHNSLSKAYQIYKKRVNDDFYKLKQNEEELNRIFINIYGLEDELSAEVDEKDISIHKIYDTKKDVPENMSKSNYVLTKRDVVIDLISYAVGCMFGRYSLDEDGLIYAGGEWDESKYKSFEVDEDNIIPILDKEYFPDDIDTLFYNFIKKAFGEESINENMLFITDALGCSTRQYFMKDFYTDHLKRYQKRPIYWMFSSPKGGFNALMYMHRANKNVVSVVYNYLTSFKEKIGREIKDLKDDKGKLKELNFYSSLLSDAEEYQKTLYEVANKHIEFNTDDGVSVNYALYGKALKKIK